MRRDLSIIAGLVAMTAAAFCAVALCGFINFDDPLYIIENSHVLGGLSWENFRWAWTTFYAGNYLPLTWLSLMLDATLFGTGPEGFHLVNLAFHTANVVLVYLWFRRATGAVWRSALVAAIFAVHPLRVESVAWIVERKDVLTAFFAMLAMLAYLRFAGTLKWIWYAAVLVLFAAALLAKQTLATFPFLLLLLDYWPLGRWVRGPAPYNLARETAPRRTLPQLIVEKLPLLVMVAAIAFVTVKAQKTTESVASLSVISPADRLANAPVSYVRYLGKMVWFDSLAVYYPPHAWSAVQIAGACAALVAITIFALAKLRSSPWLAVGWFWFLGVLVPMIGLIQFGDQSMADRFTYISGIGILVMVVWSIPDGVGRRKPILTGAVAAIVLGILCLYTFIQISYWRNSVTLFTHDIEVAGASPIAETNLGAALNEKGDHDAAIPHLQTALNLRPNLALAHYDLAAALVLTNRVAEAYPHILAAVQLEPSNSRALALYASVLNMNGQFDAAEQAARAAIALNPRLAGAYYDRGYALWKLGNAAEAADQFRAALSLNPGLVAARRNLESLQAAQKR
jgi:cytochrome c-type biogenesis protein CcmH/NrfG